MKYKQHNKLAYTQDEMKRLFEMGKNKSKLDDIYSEFPNRKDNAIRNKLCNMGFKMKGGYIV